MRASNHVRRVVAACGMVAACLGGCRPADADDTAAAVARVGGDTITRGRLAEALKRSNAAAIPEGPQRRQAEAAVLEQLVHEMLLRQAAARAGVEVDPAAVEAQVQRIKTDVAKQGGTFAAFLAQTGRDEALLREQIAAELAIKQFVATRVTPEAVAAYFSTHRRELDGSLVRVSHIVLRPDIGRGEQSVTECLDRAREIRSRILQGEITFAEAVRAHSVGPSRRREGDVGFIPRQGVAHDEFARQAFTLAKGDISAPFATPSGIHLLLVTDSQPGVLTLPRVQQQIEQILVGDVIRETLAAGRRTTAIEFEPGITHFDPQTPPDAGVPRRVIGVPNAP